MLQTARGKVIGVERCDFTDCKGESGRWGHVMFQTEQGGKSSVGRDVMLQTARGKVSVGKDVMLQTVQGGKWSVGDLMLLTVQGGKGSVERNGIRDCKGESVR